MTDPIKAALLAQIQDALIAEINAKANQGSGKWASGLRHGLRVADVVVRQVFAENAAKDAPHD
jgi:hypothetical protein